jgi:hypothetical protein
MAKQQWRRNYYETHKEDMLQKSEEYRKSHMKEFRTYRKKNYKKHLDESRLTERKRSDYKAAWIRRKRQAAKEAAMAANITDDTSDAPGTKNN